MGLQDDISKVTEQAHIEAVAKLLKEHNIKPEEVGSIKSMKVGKWQTVTKDEAGEAQIHDLKGASIVLSPKWDLGPEWPVITPGPKYSIPKNKAKSRKTKQWETAVILPDMQMGYYKKSLELNAELEPIHDEKAIAIAIKLVEDMKPDQVVMLGDNLDFAEFGKYLTAPTFKQLTQATIDRATLLCAQIRNAAPNATITWIAGNHEARLARYIQTNAEAAFGLTRGKLMDELRENWPVLSVPNLCRMDEFGVNYLSGYPESFLALNENLIIRHGDRVTSNGSTTTKYLNDAHKSVIYGHIHRVEVAYRTRVSESGPRTIMAASPGCLCRIDGAVPSTKSGADEFGRPLMQGAENWQQGLAVVQYQPKGVGEEWFNYEQMWIYNGRGIFRGVEYVA
jgi:predicted phosphodiesterase